MPKRKLRPCLHHSCHELTRETYCGKHATVKVQQSKDANKFYNDNVRDKKNTAFYKSKQWERVRVYILQRDFYLCQVCIRERVGERPRVATIVDHIIPYEVDMARALDEDNLQGICQPCHNKKTAEDKVKYKL